MFDKCVPTAAKASRTVSPEKIMMYRIIPSFSFSKKYNRIPPTVTGITEPKIIVDTLITWKDENPVTERKEIAKIKLDIIAKIPPSSPDNAYLVSGGSSKS